MGIVVDIEVAALAQRRGGIVPGVARIVGTDAVTELVAGIGVRSVVEIVVARCPDDEEITAIGEGLAEMLELGKANTRSQSSMTLGRPRPSDAQNPSDAVGDLEENVA